MVANRLSRLQFSRTIVFCVSMIAFGLSSSLVAKAKSTTRPTAMIDVGTEVNEFSLELFSKLQPISDNCCIAPLPVREGLLLLSSGAKGLTQEQLLRTCHCQAQTLDADKAIVDALTAQPDKADPIVSFGNALLVNNDTLLSPNFLDDTIKIFDAEVFRRPHDADDASVVDKKIDAWINRKTRGKIAQIINPGGIMAEGGILELSTVYFRASWLTVISPEDTHDIDFTTQKRDVIRVPAMTIDGSFHFGATNDWTAVTLPYYWNDIANKDPRRFEMMILLPNSTDSLKEAIGRTSDRVVRQLAGDQVPDNTSANFGLRQVHIKLPKFSFNCSMDFTPTLRRMGLEIPMTKDADFSALGRGAFEIGRCEEASYIDVNEKGTEAAAVSGIAVFGADQGLKKEEFIVSRPFVFIVRDEWTGTILFLGEVFQPQQKLKR
jgi:serine protease inhibitor